MATALKVEITIGIGCQLALIVYLVKCYRFPSFEIFKLSFVIFCTSCLWI